jgi:ABC-type multidrug transport system ATPase subunit
MLGKVDNSWKRGGSLRINGEEEQLGRFRKVIGYVPQEDIMHRDLSVYDNIRYSANIRLPSNWSAKQREDHVNATIAAMQIKEVQDTRVGDEVIRGVSGGQRKRCNIGIEIAAAPSLLLLDEPTSGLDSTAAMDICQVLKDLARVSSLTVAMVIHQPRIEIWNQLDELLLLAPGGLTVYQGPQRIAVQYFVDRFDIHIEVNDNPADALMDHIAKQADEFVRGWLQGGKEHVEVLKKQKPKGSIINTGNDSDHATPLVTDKKEDDDLDAPTIVLQPIVPSSSSSLSSSSSMPVPIANESRVIHVASTTPRADGNNAINGHASDPQLSRAVNSNGNGGYGSSASLIPPAFPKIPLRSTSNFIIQVKLSLVRNLWKQTANMPSLALEIGLAMFAGAMMGSMVVLKYQGVLLAPYTLLSPTPLEGLIGSVFFNVGLAISLASASAGVSVFGEEQVIYRREVAAGHHHLAYYIGVSLAQIPRLFLCGSHFAFIFHIMAQPLTSFGHWLLIVVFLYVAIYGLAALVSMLVSRKNAALLGVVVSLFMASMTSKGGMPEVLQYFSASRWATEGMFSFETKPYRHIMNVARSANDGGYQLDRFGLDIFFMFCVGIAYRLFAYIAMRWVDRKLLG